MFAPIHQIKLKVTESLRYNAKGMKKYYFQIVLILSSVCQAVAQQEPQFSQYMYEKFLYNPGYAGTYANSIELALDGRYQMSRLKEEGPKQLNLGIHGPLNRRNYAIGAKMILDQSYAIIESNNKKYPTINYTNIGFWGTVARKIRLPFGMLSIGVQPGILMKSYFNSRKLHDDDDELVNSSIRGYVLPDLGLGAYFNTDHFYAGFSVLHVIPFRYGYKKIDRDVYARLYANYFVLVGGQFSVHPDWKLEPSSQLKIVETGLWQADISCAVKFKNVASAGLSYRTDHTIIPFVRLILQDHINISYSYDSYLGALQNYAGRSHELLLRYVIPVDPVKKASVDPRYY